MDIGILLSIYESKFEKKWNPRNKCFLCKQKLTPKTRSDHHLKPRWEDRVRDGKTPCCKERHNIIHTMFHNKQLYYYLNTEEKLKKTFNRVVLNKALADYFGGQYEIPKNIWN